MKLNSSVFNDLGMKFIINCGIFSLIPAESLHFISRPFSEISGEQKHQLNNLAK